MSALPQGSSGPSDDPDGAAHGSDPRQQFEQLAGSRLGPQPVLSIRTPGPHARSVYSEADVRELLDALPDAADAGLPVQSGWVSVTLPETGGSAVDQIISVLDQAGHRVGTVRVTGPVAADGTRHRLFVPEGDDCQPVMFTGSGPLSVRPVRLDWALDAIDAVLAALLRGEGIEVSARDAFAVGAVLARIDLLAARLPADAAGDAVDAYARVIGYDEQEQGTDADVLVLRALAARLALARRQVLDLAQRDARGGDEPAWGRLPSTARDALGRASLSMEFAADLLAQAADDGPHARPGTDNA